MNMPAPALAGRHALVTGGASGIGKPAPGGWPTREHRSPWPTGMTTAAKGSPPRSAGPDGELYLADTTGFAGLNLSARILVNCAGLQHVAPVEEFPPETSSLLLRVMLEAPFLLIRAVLPGMYEAGFGRIVNISSVHGLRASEFKSAYVAAKHGLEGLSRLIALGGAERGVTSNTICPGYVRAPLVERQAAAQARAHGIAEHEVVERVPLRVRGQTAHRARRGAEMVLCLCSQAATSATGSPSSWTAAGWPGNQPDFRRSAGHRGVIAQYNQKLTSSTCRRARILRRIRGMP